MKVSERAKKLLGSPSVIVESHKVCASDPYNAETNLKGYLNFGTAENHLMTREITKKINTPLNLNIDHIQYGQLHGSDRLLESSASFFNNYLNTTSLVPENFTVQGGLSAVCEALSFCLFDEGDYLMIPTPYYSGFDFDFKFRFQVNFLEVDLDSSTSFTHEISPFESAYNSFKEKNKIKAILLTHPNNPTGEILSKKFIEDVVAFAKENSITIITDEIYALSTHKKEKHHSIFETAKDAGVNCHLLYGMAKDFSLAGFKVGFHYTDDLIARDMMQALSYFSPVSSQTGELVANILSDTEFLNDFIPLNQSRISETKELFLENLPQLDFIIGKAGLFVLLDMSKKCSSFDDEKKLHLKFLNHYKVNFLSGVDLGLKKPGYFRICFTRSRQEIEELGKRLKDLK